MKTETPQTIYLKDYTPPPFLVDTVDVDVDFQPASAIVTTTTTMRRNPAAALANAPLVLDGIEQIGLPFYAVNNKFKELDANRQYLLYCDKGVMSRLHAHHLLHEGHTNVRVYRP